MISITPFNGINISLSLITIDAACSGFFALESIIIFSILASLMIYGFKSSKILESLLPKIPTATHYDATLSSTIVRYVREQLNDAIHNSSSSNIVSPFKKSTTISNTKTLKPLRGTLPPPTYTCPVN